VTTPVRSVVVHGHFYQPPREDPWREEVPPEPSAAPFHDWNERIERECYGPLAEAGLFERISFNFGPTLFEWLERAAPATYAAVLRADRNSRARLGGHGNAIAMPYHHAILPLSSRRDKVTEVRWGKADFRRRFGREPVGMWLPETAVDHETLDVLAQEGIAFTILAPHQVTRRPAGGLPGRYRTAGGRTIALFVYDGPIAHGVAFGPLLSEPETWAHRLLETPAELVSVATDGETYGHHHKTGVQGLARLLDLVGRRDDVRVENFAAFLARRPPQEDVTLVAPSSWSCVHGVERWRSDCGCRMAPEQPSQQRWRAPLREALSWLADELHAMFEREGAALFHSPWDVRDAYGAVVGADSGARDGFVGSRLRAAGAGHGDAAARAGALLEMERNALRIFTSCAWFFDDLARIEPIQVLRYAARAIELSGPEAPRLESGLLERLALAPTNDPAVPDGRSLYLARARP
jgi:alpha-amylase/alpha-mannosidase (GH57 family)